MANGTIQNTWMSSNIYDSVTGDTQRSFNTHFPSSITDLNNIGVTNWFVVTKYASNTTNAPTTAAGMVLFFEYTANQGVQLAIQSQDTNVYIRSKSSGTWNAWKTISPDAS